jgi:hypothetical protein
VLTCVKDGRGIAKVIEAILEAKHSLAEKVGGSKA